MRKKLLVVPLILMLLISQAAPIAVQAAGLPVLRVVGQIGGVTNVTAYSGGQLYTNVGPRVVRMSLATSTPGAPVYSPALAGVPQDLKVANNLVYVALGAAGVAVLDATTLALYGQVSLPPNTDPATAVAVGASRLYVATQTTGIIAYTLGAGGKTLVFSERKTLPGETVTDVETHSITVNLVSREQLYVSSNNGGAGGSIFRFDIGTSPVLGTPVQTTPELVINAMAVTDHFVYAAGDTRFYALDALVLGAAGGISQSVEITPTYQVAVNATETAAYLLHGSPFSAGGLDVADITFIHTAPPTLLTATIDTNASADSLVPLDFSTTTYLYIADGQAGLSVATSPVATPGAVTVNPVPALQPKPASTSLVAGLDGQAFALSNGATLWTIDTSTPASLSALGNGATVEGQTFPSMAIYNGTELVVAATNVGLIRYEIQSGQEITSAETIANIIPGDVMYQAVFTGTNAIVADGTKGIAVVDMTDWTNIGITARLAFPDVATNFTMVDVVGNYAYMLDAMDQASFPYTPTLRIYDLSDLGGAGPTHVTGSDMVIDCGVNGGISGLKAMGTHLYLACGATGVQVVSVANPAAPSVVTTVATPGTALALDISSSQLYVADGSAGVAVYTIALDGSLSLVTSKKLAADVTNVAVASNGNIYATAGDAGLALLQAGTGSMIFLPLIH